MCNDANNSGTLADSPVDAAWRSANYYRRTRIEQRTERSRGDGTFIRALPRPDETEFSAINARGALLVRILSCNETATGNIPTEEYKRRRILRGARMRPDNRQTRLSVTGDYGDLQESARAASEASPFPIRNWLVATR